MDTLSLNQICELIKKLHHAREKLLPGKLAPEGAWIHEYVVRKKYGWYRYAKWQSLNPIFECNPKPSSKSNKKFTNHKHIGRVQSSTGLGMSIEVYEAYITWYNTLTLNQIEKTLENINLELQKFSEFSLRQHIEDLYATETVAPVYENLDSETILNNIISVEKTYPVNKSEQATSSGKSFRHLKLVTEQFTPDY